MGQLFREGSGSGFDPSPLSYAAWADGDSDVGIVASSRTSSALLTWGRASIRANSIPLWVILENRADPFPAAIIEGGSGPGLQIMNRSDYQPALSVKNSSTDGSPQGPSAIFENGDVLIRDSLKIDGNLQKAGGSFKIDHPLDPENKHLSHSFVESPDMKNIYDGTVTLDQDGNAIVELPNWFEALNMDFRYQLTCVGSHAPIYISQEIEENKFKISGGIAGMKVCWQVTGTRHDPWANSNRIEVEEEKPPQERGYYLHSSAYGVSEEKSIKKLFQARFEQNRQPSDVPI